MNIMVITCGCYTLKFQLLLSLGDGIHIQMIRIILYMRFYFNAVLDWDV